MIDTLGISFVDFALEAQKREMLEASGRACTCSFLQEWQGNAAGIERLLSTAILPVESPPDRCGWLHPE